MIKLHESEVDRGMLICLLSALVHRNGGMSSVLMGDIEEQLHNMRLEIEFDSTLRQFTLRCSTIDKNTPVKPYQSIDAIQAAVLAWSIKKCGCDNQLFIAKEELDKLEYGQILTQVDPTCGVTLTIELDREDRR